LEFDYIIQVTCNQLPNTDYASQTCSTSWRHDSTRTYLCSYSKYGKNKSLTQNARIHFKDSCRKARKPIKKRKENGIYYILNLCCIHVIVITIINRGQPTMFYSELFTCSDSELCISMAILLTPKLILSNQQTKLQYK